MGNTSRSLAQICGAKAPTPGQILRTSGRRAGSCTPKGPAGARIQSRDVRVWRITPWTRTLQIQPNASRSPPVINLTGTVNSSPVDHVRKQSEAIAVSARPINKGGLIMAESQVLSRGRKPSGMRSAGSALLAIPADCGRENPSTNLQGIWQRAKIARRLQGSLISRGFRSARWSILCGARSLCLRKWNAHIV